MSLPDQTPKLPKLPFLIGDAILLAAAWYLANQNPGPLTANTMAAVTACVAVASILGAIPFLTDYARRQDVALDERQRGLEALSRTINTAAEQISIAANGLNELTDLTHKNLKQAEQLPHRLQDKISEFNAQLDHAREDDREELEKELAELRTVETERLQTLADKIHKAVAELAKLDASIQSQLTARADLVERSKATIENAQTSSAAALSDAATKAADLLIAAQTKALAAIDAALAQRTALAIAAIHTTSARENAIVADTPPDPTVATQGVASSSSADITSPPKRPRKARRDEPVSTQTSSNSTETSSPSLSAEQPDAEPQSSAPAASITGAAEPSAFPPSDEPAPVPTEAIPRIEPVAPASTDPFFAAQPTPESDLSSPAPASETKASQNFVSAPDSQPPLETASPATEKPARKKASRKTSFETTQDLPLNLEGEGFNSSASDDQPAGDDDPIEPVISSDGATRLIATAYIGIGNRLFIRGNGPGLSWEKGVPLQFVSIGKWRWETSDAAEPIAVKLYKNDDVECASLGTLTLDPGHQQEVTAKF